MRVHKRTKNLAMLGVVARGLRGLKGRVVFVGGATIDLYMDPGAPESRATDDVDCVVELGTRGAYHLLEEELRALGFRHPLGEKAPICRWMLGAIPVDVMPAQGAVLGFTNRWYREGLEHARLFTLADGQEIAAFSLPYLLAAKLEAFRNRGRGDYMGSRDLEDVAALLDGCAAAERDIAAAPDAVRGTLVEEVRALLDTGDFVLGLDGHLGVGPRGRERVERCLALMRRIAGSR